jgi:hypothetical protein
VAARFRTLLQTDRLRRLLPLPSIILTVCLLSFDAAAIVAASSCFLRVSVPLRPP